MCPSSDNTLSVTVDTEGDGRRLELHVGRGETVQHAIDELYDRLGRQPRSDDRLRCAVRNEDVLFFARLSLQDHLEHCPDLHWLFASPAGGAGPL